jgi:hypothetical protein
MRTEKRPNGTEAKIVSTHGNVLRLLKFVQRRRDEWGIDHFECEAIRRCVRNRFWVNRCRSLNVSRYELVVWALTRFCCISRRVNNRCRRAGKVGSGCVRGAAHSELPGQPMNDRSKTVGLIRQPAGDMKYGLMTLPAKKR